MAQYTLGGVAYSAPDKLGAGARARVIQALVGIGRQKYAEAVNIDVSLFGELKDPQALLAWCLENYPYDTVKVILEQTLKPITLSVMEGYDMATEEEVAAVLSFFGVNATGKTADAQSNADTGQATSETATANP